MSWIENADGPSEDNEQLILGGAETWGDARAAPWNLDYAPHEILGPPPVYPDRSWNPFDDVPEGYEETDQERWKPPYNPNDDDSDLMRGGDQPSSDGESAPKKHFWHSKKPPTERREFTHPKLTTARRLLTAAMLATPLASTGFIWNDHADGVAQVIDDMPHRREDSVYTPEVAKRLATQFAEQDNAELIVIELESQGIVHELPLACQPFITTYVDGARAKLPEDSAVDDIAAEPGAPCGESQATVRDNLQKLRGNHTQMQELQRQLKRGAVALRAAEEEMKVPFEDRRINELPIDIVLGLFVGAIAASVTILYDQRQRNRLNDEINAIKAAQLIASATPPPRKRLYDMRTTKWT